jgi:hypothetical protein
MEFGGAHYALAGYNAGESRVREWLRERPPLPADEFTDDIPFAGDADLRQTHLSVPAEDYRRLYGGGLLDPNVSLRRGCPGGSIGDDARPGSREAGVEAPAKKRQHRPANPPERAGADGSWTRTDESGRGQPLLVQRIFRSFVAPVLADVAAGRPGLHLIDCGCGVPGYNLNLLAPHGRAFGFDLTLSGVVRVKGGHPVAQADITRHSVPI